MFNMFNHIAIPVKNLKKSRAFYEGLGFTVFGDWKNAKRKLSSIDMKHPSGTLIELMYHPDNKSIVFPTVAEVLHLGLEVDDIEKTFRRVGSAELVTIWTEEGKDRIKEYAIIRDPNGFPIELFVIKEQK